MHLPRLKTTERRVGRTEVVHRILPRGEAADEPLEASKRRCEEVSEVEDELGVEGHDNDDTNLLEDDDMMETADTDAPKISLYSIKQRANVAAWESLRPALLTAVVECCAMPEDQLCTLCCNDEASFRCKQCGPCVYYCSNFLHGWHTCNNIFHTAEEWKVQ